MTFFYSVCHGIDSTVKAVEQRLKDPLRAKRDTHASDERCIEGT
jgi:hypothetical protein